MNAILHAARLLGLTERKLKRGILSRQPLTMLRLEWRGDRVEADWIIRPPDYWDLGMSAQQVAERQAEQALTDALAVRELVFEAFPAISSACLRAFRPDAKRRLELVILGRVDRMQEGSGRVSSILMRAQLAGFEFSLLDGILAGVEEGNVKGA